MQDFQDNTTGQLEDIDIKELIFKLLSYSPLYIVLGALGIAVAWIINRYATDIYKLSIPLNDIIGSTGVKVIGLDKSQSLDLE